jgi:electron transfer flavoprotein alpha subunit
MAKILVLMETDGAQISESNVSALKFTQELSQLWQADYDLLIIGGPDIRSQIEPWQNYGASNIQCVANTAFEHLTADRVAAACEQAMRTSGASTLVGGATTFGKDVLPRIAEKLELPMVSDVISIDAASSRLRFVRPMYAGNITATVELTQPSAVFSVRLSAFRNPDRHNSASSVTVAEIDTASIPNSTEWISLEAAARTRPELTSARVVVSGGRPLRDAETFEQLLGGLADTLQGAVGATRAAVDSGIAPNELQVGQTGKVVAPDLYIAAGVSGSVQHLAGMKDSRVIVAINTDPEAPIFSVADYGLVADLPQAIPELTEAVRAGSQKQR